MEEEEEEEEAEYGVDGEGLDNGDIVIDNVDGDDDGQKLEDGHDRVMEEMDPVVGMASSDEEEEETDGGYQSNSKREWKDERRVKVVRSAVSSVAEMPLEEQNAKEAVDGDKEGDEDVEGGFIDPADIQR